MRKIYPKLITTLFIVLLAAVLIRFADSDDKGPKATATSHLQEATGK